MGLIKKAQPKSDNQCFEASPPTQQEAQPIVNYHELLLQTQGQDSYTVRQAIKALADYPESISHLVRLLTENESSLIRQAIFDSLRRIAFDEAHPVSSQTAAESGESSDSVTCEYQQQVVDEVLALIQVRDAQLRNQVICFVSEFPEVVAKRIPSLLKDPQQETRLYTLDILLYLVHPDVPTWLSDCLQNETDANVLTSAIDRVVSCGCFELIHDVAHAGRRYQLNPMVSFAADMAIERLGGI